MAGQLAKNGNKDQEYGRNAHIGEMNIVAHLGIDGHICVF